MKVSVVIPTYNEEKYIEKCLQSLSDQTEKPDEIIVVDNNCTDRTVELAQHFEKVHIVKETTQGMIPARNTGFNAAQHDIIARCDADTILPSDWIQRIKADFEEKNIDGLTGPITFYDLPSSKNNAFVSKIYSTSLKIILRGNEIFFGPNMILLKSVWEEVKHEVCIDDKKVHEDVDLSIHLIKHNKTIYHDKQLLIKTSARRIKNKPHSFFIEYPLRMAKTLAIHI